MNTLRRLLALLLSPTVMADTPLQLYLLMGQSNMAGRDTRDLASQVDDPGSLALHVCFADPVGLGHLGDDLHFSADASRELGRRFARAMQALKQR